MDDHGRTCELHKRKDDEKGTCAFTLIVKWINFYENEILEQKLNDNELIFPKLDKSQGKIKLGKEMTHGDFLDLLNYWANEAWIVLIVNGEIGYFTLHCFRRGGAQHQFMFTIHGKWSISAVKWWGGWSPNEKADTIKKYLLEELESDEMDFRDMFSPLRNSEKRVTFGGETEYVTKEFFVQAINSMQSSMMRLISNEISSLHHHVSSSSTSIISSFSPHNQTQQHLANSTEQNKSSASASYYHSRESAVAEKQNDSSSISINSSTDHNQIMLNNAALPHTSTIEDVLLFW